MKRNRGFFSLLNPPEKLNSVSRIAIQPYQRGQQPENYKQYIQTLDKVIYGVDPFTHKFVFPLLASFDASEHEDREDLKEKYKEQVEKYLQKDAEEYLRNLNNLPDALTGDNLHLPESEEEEAPRSSEEMLREVEAQKIRIKELYPDIEKELDEIERTAEKEQDHEIEQSEATLKELSPEVIEEKRKAEKLKKKFKKHYRKLLEEEKAIRRSMAREEVYNVRNYGFEGFKDRITYYSLLKAASKGPILIPRELYFKIPKEDRETLMKVAGSANDIEMAQQFYEGKVLKYINTIGRLNKDFLLIAFGAHPEYNAEETKNLILNPYFDLMAQIGQDIDHDCKLFKVKGLPRFSDMMYSAKDKILNNIPVILRQESDDITDAERKKKLRDALVDSTTKWLSAQYHNVFRSFKDLMKKYYSGNEGWDKSEDLRSHVNDVYKISKILERNKGYIPEEDDSFYFGDDDDDDDEDEGYI